MDLKEVGWEVMYWIHQVQDFEKWWAVVNTVLILQVLYIAGSFVTS